MKNRATAILVAAVLICLIPAASHATLAPYSQDFEGLDATSPTALSGDGWLVYGNVFTPDWIYIGGYGAFPAPNHSLAFCQIVTDQGGPEQGLQQLVVFSDYENLDHAAGNWIESNVYQEQTIAQEDTGTVWAFAFNAKRGNIEGASTAFAFIKTLDPDNGYATTNLITVETTAIDTLWGGYGMSIAIADTLAGQLLQFGFYNVATNYEGSGIFYDNLGFRQISATDVPDGASAIGATLLQNYPNPFNPRTRIEFAIERPGPVDVSVYDLAGRRIATVYRGELAAGQHAVTWDGKTDTGNPASAGLYHYVLKTTAGQVSRSMVLVK
jgi:hypothetical protein